MLAEILPIFTGAISFVTCHSLRVQTRTTFLLASNSTLFHQVFCNAQFMLLSRREEKGNRFALSITTNMNFGRESPLAVS